MLGARADARAPILIRSSPCRPNDKSPAVKPGSSRRTLC